MRHRVNDACWKQNGTAVKKTPKIIRNVQKINETPCFLKSDMVLAALCICCIHILDILCKVSEHIASNKQWKLCSSTTPLSFEAPPQWTPAHICIYLIFLKTRNIDLHYAADSIGQVAFNVFWWAPKNDFISARVTFRPFQVIQGHWFWCQLKARIRLPISPS